MCMAGDFQKPLILLAYTAPASRAADEKVVRRLENIANILRPGVQKHAYSIQIADAKTDTYLFELLKAPEVKNNLTILHLAGEVLKDNRLAIPRAT